MGIVGRIKRQLDSVYSKLVARHRITKQKKSINDPRRKKIRNRYALTPQQIKQTEDYYLSNYGKKIHLFWHELYYGVSGKFDYRYFPEYLYIPILESILNNDKASVDFLSNKVNQYIFFSPRKDLVKMPELVGGVINNLPIDQNLSSQSFQTLSDNIKRLKQPVFIKPLRDSSGRGCYILKHEEISEGRLRTIAKEQKGSYLIQKVIKNSEQIRKIYPTALNTFRIVTYRLNGKIFHMPSVLRIGRGGNNVDNAHAGGIFVGIADNGEFLPTAHTEFGLDFASHPDSGFIFENSKIEGFGKLIVAAEQLHRLLPYMGIVFWDLALRENDEPILVEANTEFGGIWLSQMAHGIGPFGDNTDEILKILRQKKLSQ